MSSIIRQDISTKDWTIFSVKRAERPHDFKGSKEKKKILKKYEPSCPFCKGNESMTPEELLVINGGKDWSVRVWSQISSLLLNIKRTPWRAVKEGISPDPIYP